MARNNFDNWIPEEFGSNVIQRVQQVSALETYAQRIPMQTQVRSTPRSGGVGVSMVAKGSAYAEDTTSNDQVLLNVQKFGSAVRIAEEDINDSLADIVNAKMTDWATSYAKALDNACLGVTAAKATSGCAFDSVYYQLTQVNAATGYSANANIVKTTTVAADATKAKISYSYLSQTLGLVEQSDFWDEAGLVIIAHPSFKRKVRDIVDSSNRPIFQESTAGFPGGGQGKNDLLFGYPVRWSLGARGSAAATSNPTGNPLMFFASSQYLLLGIRSGPESVFIDGRNGLAALTDESILKMRSRRGFALGNENAVSVLEDVNGV